MTAANIIRNADCVYIVSDGAGLNMKDGTLEAIAPKVFCAPHINAAFVVRGRVGSFALLQGFVCGLGQSYDEMKANCHSLSTKWKECCELWRKSGIDPAIFDFDLFVAGWSDITGPDSFMLSSHNVNAEFGLSAWQMVDPGPVALAPSTPGLGSYYIPRLTAAFDTSLAIALIEQQRQFLSPFGDIEAPTVGAFAQINHWSISERVMSPL